MATTKANTTTNATASRRESRDTAERILDTAEELVRVRGFNAFSYADVATSLGVTKASLHYHFSGKAELGQALIDRYARRFGDALARIDQREQPASAKLDAYADLYAQALRGQRMCLCGMLAADYETLPQPIREGVVSFFDENEAWLERLLAQGRAEGSLEFSRPAQDTARMIIAGLEGAMLVARPYGDLKRFRESARTLLASLTS